MAKPVLQLRNSPTSAGAAAALSFLERRWGLRIVWELRAEPLNFRALQAACGDISPSVLQRRLHGLRALALIERIPPLGYRLTAPGDQLFRILAPLDDWANSLDESALYSHS